MSSMTRLETFVNLGYSQDPFKKSPVRFDTGDMVRCRRILTMAVNSRAMVSIVGERGCGKTEAVESALKGMSVPMQIIRVQRDAQEKLTIDDIKTALIAGLSEEGVRRGGIASHAQLRRVLGTSATKKNVQGIEHQIVVVIEEAQRIHSNTLRSLKTLREIEWASQRELCTIVLLAQSDPMNRTGVSEVRLRSDLVRMQGLSANEAAHYVREIIGAHFDEAAIEALAELPAARNYLELQALCVELINIALADGREQVTIADVRSTVRPDPAQIPRKQPRQKPTAAAAAPSSVTSVLARRNATGQPAEGGLQAC